MFDKNLVKKAIAAFYFYAFYIFHFMQCEIKTGKLILSDC